MLTVNICLLGVAILAGSLWLRASPDRGGWANGGLGELLIAYCIPLWGAALIALGIGRNYNATAGGPLNALYLVLGGIGFLLLLLGAAAFFGVPMPKAMLPAWLRKPR